MKTLLRKVLRSLGWDMYKYPQSCEKADAHLAWLLQRRNFDIVLDVGANVGQFGRELRAVGYSGPLVSFEPIPEVFAKLKAVADREQMWFVQNCGLGRAEGVLPLNVMKSSDFSSFMMPSDQNKKTFVDGSAIERVIEVPVHRLDQILPECLAKAGSPGRSILLKMDTQGFDDAVLDGANGCLDRVVGLMTEVSVRPLYAGVPRYLESLSRLEGMGFELTGMFPVTRDEQMRVIEFNCVMVKPI